VPLIFLDLFVFANSDKSKFDKNECEKNAVLHMTQSIRPIVKFDNCTVLSWSKIENPKESGLNAKLLKIWKIINDDKLYYQKSPVGDTSFRQ
jgi:hypothetical protein